MLSEVDQNDIIGFDVQVAEDELFKRRDSTAELQKTYIRGVLDISESEQNLS